MATMYPSEMMDIVDWGNPVVYWVSSIAKNASKTVTTTKRPKFIMYMCTRSDSQYRNMVVWDDVKQEGVRGYYSSSAPYYVSLDSSNLGSSGMITSITDTGFTLKNTSTSYTYYYTAIAWY